MRIFMFAICSLLATSLFCSEYVSIRNTFYEVSREKVSIDVFLSELNNMESPNAPVSKAYKAMGEFLLAKESWNPFVKYEQFVKGKKILEAAVEKDPQNIEIIYLRLCTQTALPPILKYNQNIENDSRYLIDYYPNIEDQDLKEKVKMLLLEYKYCDPKDLT